MTVPVNNDDSTHISTALPGSKHLLDLTKEERDEYERKPDDDNSNSTEMQATTVNSKHSNVNPNDCDYWNISRLSVDRRFTKSASPIPLTSLSNINNSSNTEFGSSRVPQFYRQNDSNQSNYTDDISKHIHYIFNRNTQSVDSPDRISLLTSSPDPANTTQNQSYSS